MLSDEWLSRYGLLENFNASVTRTRTRTGTGTWTTGVTAIALCTSCSRAKKPKCNEQRFLPAEQNGLFSIDFFYIFFSLLQKTLMTFTAGSRFFHVRSRYIIFCVCVQRLCKIVLIVKESRIKIISNYFDCKFLNTKQ